MYPISNQKRYLKLKPLVNYFSRIYFRWTRYVDECVTEPCFSSVPYFVSLQWRHNEHDGVSNHRLLDSLLNRMFRSRSDKNIKAPPLKGPGENSVSWRYHGTACYVRLGTLLYYDNNYLSTLTKIFFSNTWWWNCGSRNYSKTWNAGCT